MRIRASLDNAPLTASGTGRESFVIRPNNALHDPNGFSLTFYDEKGNVITIGMDSVTLSTLGADCTKIAAV